MLTAVLYKLFPALFTFNFYIFNNVLAITLKIDEK